MDKRLASIYLGGVTPYTYRALILPVPLMRPGCLLRTTSEQCHFVTYMYKVPPAIKYPLPTGPIHPSSHDMPLGCPSPLSNQAPPHDLQRPSAGSATSSTVCVKLHHEQPPPSASRQCYTNITPGYVKPSLRVTQVPNRLAMCLELGWVRAPGTSLPMRWA